MSKGVILVVDDDTLIRMCAVDFAEEAGYAAVEAADAAEALAVLEGGQDIAVLFTDVRMPGAMDGLALAHAVRARWPGVKILVASGAGGERDGFASLPKPYGLTDFLQAIEGL